MTTLIIYAHPNLKGNCAKILQEIESRLKSRKIDYELIDLYKIKYDPVLHEDELYTAGNRNVSKQNKEFQGKIIKADKLIFIYPNWWNGMPAILKGFIDRIMTPRFAFLYDNKIPKGLLKGKKAAVFLTTGAPKLLFKIFERGGAAKAMKKDVLKFCGIKSKVFIIGKASKLDEKQIRRIEKSVEDGLDYLY